MKRDATPNQLIEHVQFIRDEAKRITKSRGRIQKVLVSQEERKEEETSLSFMKFEFTTTSSFQNFFSEEADTARADIDYFLNNKAEYARTGRPWNYTVLNEGPPGVGKTKLVKSIAAYTGRTLVVLDLQHIESLRMLYEAFHSSVLGGEHLEHTKRLYYIPEVDTQIHNHLKQRNIEKPIIVLDDKESKDTKDDKKSLWKGPKRPTLGEVLNILDGIPERHGHIIIIDTNHMNELDAALIRPGRVDRILSWGKMTAVSMRRFLENFYRETISEDVVFPERQYTAAELQACVHRFPTLDEFLASVNMTREKLNSSARRSKHVRRTIA
jgi:ATP-dependent 26S proteasome regulatory subunit